MRRRPGLPSRIGTPVELARGRVRLAEAGRGLLRDEERPAVRGEAEARRTELDTVEAAVGQPHAGRAATGRDPPDHRLAVVGQVHLASATPRREVRDRRLVDEVRGAVVATTLSAGRQVRERGVPAEAARPGVQQEHPRGRLLEQHEAAPGVAEGDLHAVRLVQPLAGDGPRAQQRAASGPLEDPGRDAVSRRVGVAACVDASVGVCVGERRVAGVRHEREHPRVPLRAGLGRVGPGGALGKGEPRDDARDDDTSHSLSNTSRAARSPARTAPSM